MEVLLSMADARAKCTVMFGATCNNVDVADAGAAATGQDTLQADGNLVQHTPAAGCVESATDCFRVYIPTSRMKGNALTMVLYTLCSATQTNVLRTR